MSFDIYYFSGTGNSLQVARELQKRIPEIKLIPIAALLNKNVIKSSAEKIGFIFPIHAFTFPLTLKDFLNKLDPSSADYIFAIATRGGSPCRVFNDINKILKKKGKALDTGFFINMPNNYILSFPAPTNEEISECESEMLAQMGTIQEIILKKGKNKEKDPHSNFIKENIIFPPLTFLAQKTRYFNLENQFYSDSKCNGCKTCEKVCLSGKIRIENKKPVWQKNVKCFFCFACLNYCPLKSVQIGKSKTPYKERYFHPKITPDDIAMQKKV